VVVIDFCLFFFSIFFTCGAEQEKMQRKISVRAFPLLCKLRKLCPVPIFFQFLVSKRDSFEMVGSILDK
jgi:hypothetical protein